MTTPMNCAACGTRCTWPKDFPFPHYSVCNTCHTSAERQAIESRAQTFFIGLGFLFILFAITVGVVLVEC